MAALPLHGRRIIVTRPREQAQEMVTRLQALGAEAIALPTIVIGPPDDWAPLDYALGELPSFAGFIFTSARGVEGFFARAAVLELDTTAPLPPRRSGSWVCAIGLATAAALDAHPGWAADICPRDSRAEGVVAALAGLPLAHSRILMPRAAEGREVIPEALARRCATVITVATHSTRLPHESASRARELVPGSAAVVFTSSSSARHLALLLGDGYRRLLQGVLPVAIGPVTRATLEDLGLTGVLEAGAASTDALIAALVAHWQA